MKNIFLRSAHALSSRRSFGLSQLVVLLAIRIWDPAPLEELRLRSLDLYQNLSPRISDVRPRSEEHTSELQSLRHLVCRLLLAKKKRFSCSARIDRRYSLRASTGR